MAGLTGYPCFQTVVTHIQLNDFKQFLAVFLYACFAETGDARHRGDGIRKEVDQSMESLLLQDAVGWQVMVACFL